MKKILLLLVALILLLSVGCRNQNAVIEETTQPKETTTEPTATAEPTATPQPELTMPTLPDQDYTDLDFFEDGYEIVEYKGLADGDTAIFVVGNLPISTRFLAIDTPETNSSTDGMQPWAMAAKEYTRNKLENAEQIILELDEESDIFDNYNRLLAWIWVDGELLNYLLVEEGLAYVKYLYGDYKYNSTMIRLESQAQKKKIKIWGEDDPDYDYEKSTIECTIGEARQVTKGSNVKIRGVVTNVIDKNAFIQDETGAIYIYANKYNYSALKPGVEVELEGKVIEYNGLLEISNIKDKKITNLSEGNVIEPAVIQLSEVDESVEGQYIRINDLEITDVVTVDGQKGFDVVVKQGDDYGVIRIDKYLKPYPDPASFVVGSTVDVVGNIGQYNEIYQIMISSREDVYDH